MRRPTDHQQHYLTKTSKFGRCWNQTIGQNHKKHISCGKENVLHKWDMGLCFHSLLCVAQQAQQISCWQAGPSGSQVLCSPAIWTILEELHGTSRLHSTLDNERLLCNISGKLWELCFPALGTVKPNTAKPMYLFTNVKRCFSLPSSYSET